MSHVSNIELHIKSLEALKAACKELGIIFRENRKTYKWYGSWIGDHPLPEGMRMEDLGKCDHCIEVPGCTYEIGVIRRNDQWQLIWDFWHKGGLQKKLGQNAGKLKQAYTAAAIRMEAKQKGYRVRQERVENGIRMVLAMSG
jgi:hypothetical protein